MRALVFGDSIVRRLAENVSTLDSESSHLDLSYTVFCFPGATIQTLRQAIYESDIQTLEQPDIVVLHVGTNSTGVGTERAVQQVAELVEAAKHVTQCSNVLLSLILPRWDCEDKYQKTLQLNSAFKKNFAVIDCTDDLLDEDLYDTSKLHLNFEHGNLFAKVFATNVCSELQPQHHSVGQVTPNWWIPPLRKLPKVKKKEDETKESRSPPAPPPRTTPKPSPSKPSPSWQTCATRVKRMEVSLSNGYTQIGFKPMDSPDEVVIALPFPCGCMSKQSQPATSYHTKASQAALPHSTSPYVKRKQLGKKKKRKRIRDKKARDRKKRTSKVINSPF